jgi:hypothetical protein
VLGAPDNKVFGVVILAQKGAEEAVSGFVSTGNEGVTPGSEDVVHGGNLPDMTIASTRRVAMRESLQSRTVAEIAQVARHRKISKGVKMAKIVIGKDSGNHAQNACSVFVKSSFPERV